MGHPVVSWRTFSSTSIIDKTARKPISQGSVFLFVAARASARSIEFCQFLTIFNMGEVMRASATTLTELMGLNVYWEAAVEG
jgi:hypothetical protein